jgi:hypothetical protein
MMKPIFRLLGPLAALILFGSLAYGQERHESRGHPPRAFRAPPHVQFDAHHHHDHYYPARGYAVAALPPGHVSVAFRGGHYYFHGGVWFRPVGPRFVVIAPPPGIVVPVLPPAYATLWIGGAPYYYANGAYYAPAPGGYAVVEPPPDVDTVQAQAPPPAPRPPSEPIIYPRNGQSAQKTEADRQECNRWATTHPNAVADAEVFQRAVAACMDGRGYTVR